MVIALLAPLVVSNPLDLSRADTFLIYCLPAIGLNFASGLGGQLALGEPVIMGVAAYTSGLLVLHLHLSVWVTILAAVAIAVALSTLLGLPGLRVRGWYLAILTFFVIGIFPNIVNLWQNTTGGGNGLIVPPLTWDGNLLTSRQTYELALLAVIIVWVAVRNVSVSSWGVVLRQVRDNPIAAEAGGTDLRLARLRVYALLGVPCGISGWLLGHTLGVVAPVSFSLNLILLLIGAVFLGGEGTLWGPIVGVGIFETITLVIGPFSVWNTLYLGLGVLVSALVFRGGVIGTVQQLWVRYRRDVGVRPEAAAEPSREHPQVTRASVAAALAPPRSDTSGSPALSVAAISKRFGGNVVLEGATFEVRRGELVGLIGSNGSGKTTLLNIITRVLSADSGRIEIFGREIGDRPAHGVARLGLRRTFQQPRLVDELTVLQNVALGAYAVEGQHMFGAICRFPSERRRSRGGLDAASRACITLGFETDLLDTKVGELSLGMKRVVEVARAVVGEPLVLCLDEPAAGLTEAEQARLANLFDVVRASGVSILLVEHNLELVMRTCDEVLLLERGRISGRGRPAERFVDDRLKEYLGQYTIGMDDGEDAATLDVVREPMENR
jgi:ABC-type branched-subunit amino acid transport system ATPase component/ABC-type branched-subunit amino acid transport system permease subunit